MLGKMVLYSSNTLFGSQDCSTQVYFIPGQLKEVRNKMSLLKLFNAIEWADCKSLIILKTFYVPIPLDIIAYIYSTHCNL